MLNNEKKSLQLSIYVPPDKVDTWKEITEGAKAESRGLGFYICEMWERNKTADFNAK